MVTTVAAQANQQYRGGKTLRKIATITAVVLALAMLTASVAMAAGSNNGVDPENVVQEFDLDTGAAIADGDQPKVGKAHLRRSADGLSAKVNVKGLIPGGVYTFWWVIPAAGHPNGSFVALGGSKIIGQNGKATVRMSANVGDPSIAGFFDHLAPLGIPSEWSFVPLSSAVLGDEVRVEIAYHGQADQAADAAELAQWRSDFWTGETGVCADPSAIPPTFPNTGQPHCPVYYAASFTLP